MSAGRIGATVSKLICPQTPHMSACYLQVSESWLRSVGRPPTLMRFRGGGQDVEDSAKIFFRDSHRTWQAQSIAIESLRNRTLEQPAVDESPTAVDWLPE